MRYIFYEAGQISSEADLASAAGHITGGVFNLSDIVSISRQEELGFEWFFLEPFEN